MLPKLPESLVEHLRKGRCVLFAGAGMSAWAGLPSWTELLKKLAKKMVDEESGQVDSAELDEMIAGGKLLEVAQYCKDRLPPLSYNGVVSTALHAVAAGIPTPHQIIIELPFAAIVTTNYDKVIEQSYIRAGRAWPMTLTHKDTEDLSKLLFENRFFILKAHGDIDRIDTLILTASDYREMIHGNLAFSAMFSALLLTKAILFIGYSIKDPDFRMLLDRQLSIFRGSVPERYALMAGVGAIEKDILWRTARIKVIQYMEHTEIVDILGSLRAAVLGEEKAPESAASELFNPQA
jgi:hypothetical protein